jgi:hypothetical protein
VGVFDLLMEFFTFLSLIFFFWQWRESITLFIDKHFIQHLVKEKQEEDRLKK